MNEILDLTIAQCPLLPAGDGTLVARFNEVNQLRRELEQKYYDLRDELEPKRQELKKVSEQLTRSHYRVGFLGTTQVGKSRTFNNVLGVGDADSPATPGRGDATTSAISRLRRAEQNSLCLYYLSEEQFRHKRAEICKAIPGLNPAMTDAEILTSLTSLRGEVQAGQREGMVHDIDTLSLLLESYKRFENQVVRTPSLEEGTDYGRRKAILNHAASPTPSRYLLLRDVVITFRTEVIPSNLEMIDLPGLGSQGVIDSLLTLDFLRELDGALIFLRANQLGDQNVEKILGKLKPMFAGRWGERIWIIITMFDTLANDHFSSEDNWFNAVDRFIKRHDLPLANLLVTSNEVHALLRNEPAETHAERAAIKLNRPLDNPIFQNYPRFRPCLEEVYRDGGISSLRALLTGRLADAVGAEMRTATELTLRNLQRDLKRRADLEERRRKQNDAEFRKALQCRRTILQVLNELNSRPSYLDGPHGKLWEGLRLACQESLPGELLDDMPLERLAEEFHTATRSLDRQFRNLLEAEVFDPLYENVASRLRELPTVPVADADSTQDAWRAFTEQDREDGDWRRRLPAFQDDNLFAQLRHGENGRGRFDGRACRYVLDEKIRLVANRSIHTVCGRMRYRLDSLERELAALVRGNDTEDGQLS